MSLSEKFYDMIDEYEENPALGGKIAEMVLSAPDTPESDGLLAYIYHEGIGVEVNLDKCFEYAEKAALEGGDGLGYFLLGYMCDNAETPDQEHGGPRQKYDHYDAERFYEKCTQTDSRWAVPAHLWLGHYFMDSARGGDPEIAVEHFEAIGDKSDEAVEILCDYYWGFFDYQFDSTGDDKELYGKIFYWTRKAYDINPEEYAYQMGCLYEDGVGCSRSLSRAKKYFEEAYGYGDPLAADGIVDVYREMLKRPGLSPAERKKCEEELAKWDEISSQSDLLDDDDDSNA